MQGSVTIIKFDTFILTRKMSTVLSTNLYMNFYISRCSLDYFSTYNSKSVIAYLSFPVTLCPSKTNSPHMLRVYSTDYHVGFYSATGSWSIVVEHSSSNLYGRRLAADCLYHIPSYLTWVISSATVSSLTQFGSICLTSRSLQLWENTPSRAFVFPKTYRVFTWFASMQFSYELLKLSFQSRLYLHARYYNHT